MFAVGDRVADDVLKEDLQNAAGLLVDEPTDALYTTSASETANCGLGNALDVVTQDLPVTLGSALSESLSAVVLDDGQQHEHVAHLSAFSTDL